LLIRAKAAARKETGGASHPLHQRSPRWSIVCLNCAALTETLLESELSDMKRGLLRAARQRRSANLKGSQSRHDFSTKIGEMNVGTQAKLLRILEGQPSSVSAATYPSASTCASVRPRISRWKRICTRGPSGGAISFFPPASCGNRCACRMRDRIRRRGAR